MMIHSTRRPELRGLALGQPIPPTVRDDSSVPPTAGLTGALFCVTDPPPALASRAQQILDLPHRPRDLLFALPADQAFSYRRRPPSTATDAELEAIGETGIRALKLVSELIADQPRMPGWVGTTLEAGWLVYGAARLMQIWQSGADLPILAMGATELALETAQLGQDAGVLEESGLLARDLLRDVGVALVAGEAALDGDDVAMAVLDKQFAGTHDLYEMARVFEPVAGACLSSDPAFAEFALFPLPHGRSPAPGASAAAAIGSARARDRDPPRAERSADAR